MAKSRVNEKLDLKIKNLDQALNSFEKIMVEDISSFDEIIIDAIKNGQLQKFEYTLELLWKSLKSYLEIEKGQVEIYAKDVFRAAFPFTNLSEEEKELSLIMIEDRNKIAHEYKDFIMQTIYPTLTVYLKLIKKLRAVMYS
jgi:nucleotidyltransferase substrate binding protein (TIGR01987 family)